MSSCLTRFSRSASSASARRLLPVSATARSYSGPKRCCSRRRRAAAATIAMIATATTTTTMIATMVPVVMGTSCYWFDRRLNFPSAALSNRRPLAEAAGDLGGPVGQDDARAGPADRRQRLGDDPVPVDPALRRGGLYHRVLAADLVRGDRHRRGRGDLADHVEVGERRLDHGDVRALGDVKRHL